MEVRCGGSLIITSLPGLALVTATAALLWTDGRYFLQATQQLSSDWKLMRVGEDASVEEWIAVVGRWGWCLPYSPFLFSHRCIN